MEWTCTEKKSYIKMDEVYSLPFERLRAACGANGLQFELQSKSWGEVQRFRREGEDRLAQEGVDCLDMIHGSVPENHPGGVFYSDGLEAAQCATGEANS